jgi:hypothetical protein
MNRKASLYFGLAIVVAAATAFSASAASSLSNALIGFTGDSTQPATQTALAAAGFNVANTVDIDPAVVFDSNGANFGTMIPDSGGRNYMRTVESDYADIRFVAEVTLAIPTSDVPPYQSGFLGLGAGDIGFAGWPDWNTPSSSVMVVPELFSGNHFFKTMHTSGGAPTFSEDVEVPGLNNGTHRLRLTYDLFPKSAVFSIDFDYAGGAFVSDFSSPALSLIDLFGADGWPVEPARIYFGGDDGTLFKDFQVTVTGPEVRYGDFNSDGNINSLDWMILRTNQETNLSGLTIEQAYFRGDLTEDLANDHEDFVAFKNLFDAANGAGSFVAMVASVPEPSTVALILGVGLILPPLMRRRRNRN